MPRNLALRWGGRLVVLLAGVITAYLLITHWQASAFRLSEVLPAQTVALRFRDLSPSLIIKLRFPELSPSQNVALRFPGVSPQHVALRLPSQNGAPRLSDFLGPPERGATPFVTSSAAAISPEPLTHLIDFQVTAALPPIGYSRFCLHYPRDCKVHPADLLHGSTVLTPEQWNEVNSVNRAVNGGILAGITPGDGATEEWLISPKIGDCKDYAVTKQHELLTRGWPSQALLLSEVVLPSGEHHLVLVVRVKDADLVLDNLSDEIRLVAMTYDRYNWIRIQSPQNPKFWMKVRKRDDHQLITVRPRSSDSVS